MADVNCLYISCSRLLTVEKSLSTLLERALSFKLLLYVDYHGNLENKKLL